MVQRDAHAFPVQNAELSAFSPAHFGRQRVGVKAKLGELPSFVQRFDQQLQLLAAVRGNRENGPPEMAAQGHTPLFNSTNHPFIHFW